MIIFSNRKKIGKIVKIKRLELDLTLEALADKNISSSTISLIERGHENVSEDKILYLCKILDIDIEKDLEIIEQNKHKEEQEFLSKLKPIENMIDLIDPKQGLKRLNPLLKNIKPSTSPKVIAMMYYLKGRAYTLKGRPQNNEQDLVKAEKNLKESLSIIEQKPELEISNLQVSIYHELARVYYCRNDFDNALINVQKGLSSFNAKGERTYIKHTLKVSKAIYLEKLDQLHESLKILEEMWNDLHIIQNIKVILNMYETRAIVLRRLNRPREALQYCNEGIDIARFNGIHERSFDLWTVLGSIYSDLRNFERAEECFQIVSGLKNQIKKKYLFINPYTELGKLYLKRGLFSEAIGHLKEAVTIGEETNDSPRLAQALLALGDCFFHQNSLDKALPYYKRAYKIASKHKFRRLLRDILLQYVQCAKEVDYSNYHKLVDELIQIEVELKDKSDMG